VRLQNAPHELLLGRSLDNNMEVHHGRPPRTFLS
jgi:hypothetical protein